MKIPAEVREWFPDPAVRAAVWQCAEEPAIGYVPGTAVADGAQWQLEEQCFHAQRALHEQQNCGCISSIRYRRLHGNSAFSGWLWPGNQAQSCLLRPCCIWPKGTCETCPFGSHKKQGCKEDVKKKKKKKSFIKLHCLWIEVTIMRMSALILNDNQCEGFSVSVTHNTVPPAVSLVWDFKAGSQID